MKVTTHLFRGLFASILLTIGLTKASALVGPVSSQPAVFETSDDPAPMCSLPCAPCSPTPH